MTKALRDRVSGQVFAYTAALASLSHQYEVVDFKPSPEKKKPTKSGRREILGKTDMTRVEAERAPETPESETRPEPTEPVVVAEPTGPTGPTEPAVVATEPTEPVVVAEPVVTAEPISIAPIDIPATGE